jgi:hypothetical protein
MAIVVCSGIPVQWCSCCLSQVGQPGTLTGAVRRIHGPQQAPTCCNSVVFWLHGDVGLCCCWQETQQLGVEPVVSNQLCQRQLTGFMHTWKLLESRNVDTQEEGCTNHSFIQCCKHHAGKGLTSVCSSGVSDTGQPFGFTSQQSGCHPPGVRLDVQSSQY